MEAIGFKNSPNTIEIRKSHNLGCRKKQSNVKNEHSSTDKNEFNTYSVFVNYALIFGTIILITVIIIKA